MPRLDSEQSHSLGDAIKRGRMLQEGLAGDIEWQITPVTVTPVPTAVAWTRYVECAAVNAAGEVHEWLEGEFASGLSIADTSTAGTASIGSTTLTLVKGKAIVAVDGDAAAWLNAETDTLTLEALTFQGTVMSAVTSEETFTT